MLQPHIRLDENLGAAYALLPGDPARLDRIAPHLEQVQELAYNREFRSIKGLYRGIPILAVSTGIGGASAGIAVEELAKIGVKAMIRIGSCGANQQGIGIGDLILAAGAVRDDGASQTYADLKVPAIPDTELLFHVMAAAKELRTVSHVGLIRSHDSFYTDREEEIDRFWSTQGVLGADMETAALFVIGRLRGVKTASILNNVVIYGEDTAQAIDAYADGEDKAAAGERLEILTALEAFYRLEAEK